MFARPNRNRIVFKSDLPSMTKQSAKDECDIHRIIKQYQRTGIIQHVSSRRPSFQNLPDPIEYQDAMNLSVRAQEAFGQLPASIRDRFKNDPELFLQAVYDPEQEDYLRKIGVFQPKAQEAPQKPLEGSPAPSATPAPEGAGKGA